MVACWWIGDGVPGRGCLGRDFPAELVYPRICQASLGNNLLDGPERKKVQLTFLPAQALELAESLRRAAMLILKRPFGKPFQ